MSKIDIFCNFSYLNNLRNGLSKALTNAKVLINIILAPII